jgi:GTP-binding protein EngB required for normal cell division
MEAANQARLLRLKIATEKKKDPKDQDKAMIEKLQKQQADIFVKLDKIKQKFKKEDQKEIFTGICFLTFRKQLD